MIFVQLLRADGNSPDMLLLFKWSSNSLLSWPIDSGILPFSILPPRSRLARFLSFNMCAPLSNPCKPLFGKERCSNDVALKNSSERDPLRRLWPSLTILSSEHLPKPAGMLPLNWLKERSSTEKDDELMQKEDGIHP